jgi:hypothetical protein
MVLCQTTVPDLVLLKARGDLVQIVLSLPKHYKAARGAALM